MLLQPKSIFIFIIFMCYSNTYVFSQTKSKSADYFKGTEHLSPEVRVEKACGDSQSKLCNKLRSDKKYRNKYLSLIDKLNEAEKAVNKAAQKNKQQLETERKKLEKMKKRAFKTKDGSPVFPDKNGDFRKTDGSIVLDEYIFTPDMKKKFSRTSYKEYILKKRK